MNRDDALRLADRITRSWPRGAITTGTWAEILEEMIYGPAEAALRKLRDTHDTMPSIATFKSEYRAQLGTAPDPRGDCEVCEGDGWITVDRDGASRDMTPCHCKAGDENRDVHTRIIAANNAELKRLGLHKQHAATAPPAELMRHRKDLEGDLA